MLRTILKLIPVLVLTCVLVMASWEPNNFGLSYGASAPLPYRGWASCLIGGPTPSPIVPGINVIFPGSFPVVPGVLSPLDLVAIFAGLVLVLLWLQGLSRTGKNKPGQIRKVVSKYGVFYVWEGITAHRARHRSLI